MSTTIWKYTLPLDEGAYHKVTMPDGAAEIHVAAQDGNPCVWAMVSPEAPPRTAYFEIIGTGRPVPDNSIYLGTAHTPPYVWHVFALRKPGPNWPDHVAGYP